MNFDINGLRLVDWNGPKKNPVEYVCRCYKNVLESLLLLLSDGSETSTPSEVWLRVTGHF